MRGSSCVSHAGTRVRVVVISAAFFLFWSKLLLLITIFSLSSYCNATNRATILTRVDAVTAQW